VTIGKPVTPQPQVTPSPTQYHISQWYLATAIGISVLIALVLVYSRKKKPEPEKRKTKTSGSPVKLGLDFPVVPYLHERRVPFFRGPRFTYTVPPARSMPIASCTWPDRCKIGLYFSTMRPIASLPRLTPALESPGAPRPGSGSQGRSHPSSPGQGP